MLERGSPVVIALMVALTLGVGSLAFAQEKPGKPERGGPGQIHAAMRALKQAERHLERAGDAYGDHRTKALDLVRQAEKELQAGLESAKAKQPKGKPAAGSPPASTTTPAPTTTAPAPATTAPPKQ